MKRTQIGGNRILSILLSLIICMSLFACTVENDHEDTITSNITGTHSEPTPAATQAEPTPAATQVEPTPAGTQTVTELTVEDVPALVPDVLKLRDKKYEDMPFLETQEQLSEYAL